MPSIERVRTILTMPDGRNRLVIVKVETSDPGLYGVGCATFTQRPLAVQAVVDNYLAPYLQGKDTHRIEDLWQQLYVSGYWRNGPELGNAISGVDMALWDIKGKLAGMPVYDLLGGKVREAAAVYRHADGSSPAEVAERAQAYVEQGFQYVRCQLGGYGGRGPLPAAPEGAQPGAYFHPKGYARSVVELFEHVRAALGPEVELLHDVHERLTPIDAINLARRLEAYDLFFLEDALPPEQIGWFRTMRAQTSTPIAIGELFNNPHEWVPLISGRLIDFVRVHLSQIGGLSAGRKLAILAETFGVRTAWHGPADTSPVGHAAGLHLDLVSANFGVQEWSGFADPVLEVFPGCPQVRGGYLYPNDQPGLGIDVDERAAARFPCTNDPVEWTHVRLPDGSPTRP